MGSGRFGGKVGSAWVGKWGGMVGRGGVAMMEGFSRFVERYTPSVPHFLNDFPPWRVDSYLSDRIQSRKFPVSPPPPHSQRSLPHGNHGKSPRERRIESNRQQHPLPLPFPYQMPSNKTKQPNNPLTTTHPSPPPTPSPTPPPLPPQTPTPQLPKHPLFPPRLPHPPRPRPTPSSPTTRSHAPRPNDGADAAPGSCRARPRGRRGPVRGVAGRAAWACG